MFSFLFFSFPTKHVPCSSAVRFSGCLTIELGGEMTRFFRPLVKALVFKSSLPVLVSRHVMCYVVAESSGHTVFILFYLL